MANKKERIDTSSGAKPLTDNPFAQLAAGLPEGFAASPGQDVAPESTDDSQAGRRRYAVGRTRKGDYHITLERRPGGKTVTVLANVSGDTELLLYKLRKHCGAGGAARADAVEIQGDHQDAVRAFLAGEDAWLAD